MLEMVLEMESGTVEMEMGKESQHRIQHVRIDGQNSGYITTERSQDNIRIAEWALEWIK